MKVTILGAGNSGLAMAAHLTLEGNTVTLWNRTEQHIEKLLENPVINCSGVINGKARIALVTSNLGDALEGAEMVFVTTPAFSHAELAKKIGHTLLKPTTIVLNPGRTFGAMEFIHSFKQVNATVNPIVAETQTIIYTCRKTSDKAVEVYALKNDVLISTIDANDNQALITSMPVCLQSMFIPAKSMIETSIGNVGMILHCAPILLNVGWVESPEDNFCYYRTGISPTIARFIEKMDQERMEVAEKLGTPVESVKEWMKRTYQIEGNSLYQVIQNNLAYESIQAPQTLQHRYITEDIPMGLVPLEAVGKEIGLEMKTIELVIDLASSLLDIDFRQEGRNLHELIETNNISAYKILQ